MSGGRLNCAYSKVENIAYDVASNAKSNLHRAFAEHLLKVSKALHDLEWVISSLKALRTVIENARMLNK